LREVREVREVKGRRNVRVLCSKVLFASVALMLSSVAFAQTTDPGAARAQLRNGFDLKQQGRCEEAIPHFLESIRLDRQAKALLNLADCEEHLGKLVAAQQHFAEARDIASQKGVDELRAYAVERLEALDRITPKLVLKLAKGTSPDT